MTQLTALCVPGHLNGPVDSGQGGYTAGIVAALIDGPAEVSLRSRVPLDTPLDVVHGDDGGVRVLDAETLVAEAQPAGEVALDVPARVGLEEARAAAERYRGEHDGLFCRCFVCGRAREDSWGVFAGAVEGTRLVATPWTPPEWTADENGRVREEHVWAALDCPTYFALYPDTAPLSFLARYAVRVVAPVAAGEEHVIVAWPIAYDGRKHHAGAALLSAGGDVLAVARALLIGPRE